MVQHKQTRATYALKYINKMKAVKMKAVGNIIQERKLLEKVGLMPLLSPPPGRIDLCLADRPPVCRQSSVRVPGRRELFLRLRPHARWRPPLYVAFSTPDPRPIYPCYLSITCPVHMLRDCTFSEDAVRFYTAELSSALIYLHEHRIIHR
jgi:serine/threonine kinase 32